MLGFEKFLEATKPKPFYTWREETAQQVVKDLFPRLIKEYVNLTGDDCLVAVDDLYIAVGSVYMPNFDQELAEELGL